MRNRELHISLRLNVVAAYRRNYRYLVILVVALHLREKKKWFDLYVIIIIITNIIITIIYIYF
jgi:hypothetical protein